MPEEEALAPDPEPERLPEWLDGLRSELGDAIASIAGVTGGGGPADLPTITARAEAWLQVIAAVAAQGFGLFVDLGGVDRLPREPRFDLVVHLRDVDTGRLVRVRTEVAEGQVMPSISAVYPASAWPEREVFDLLGIPFQGHPDFRRLLLPDDWEGHPLRRDYPLTGPRALDPESRYAL